ncbi:MAG TPA: cobalamin biosynthesis protein [Rhizobiaceae bacterium]|nr:cobalamin biosynthesis protein [Rhizobiaceae bacterium]
MIVAGIGCRKGATTASVVAAVHAAVSKQGIGIAALDALATLRLKQHEDGIVAAGRALSLELIIVDETDANAAAERALTMSERSFAANGTRSASETAALAAAGPNSRLLAPRLALGDVTCALATDEAAP